MNILHASTAKGWRGGEQQLLYLAEEIQKKEGVRQIIFAPENSVLEQKAKERGMEVVSFAKRTSMDILAARKLKKICRQYDVELIHTHDAHAHTTAVLSAVFFHNPVDIVVSRRVDFPVKKSRFSYFKYNHPKVAKIACVSEMIQKITSVAIQDKSKLITIYSGIDPARFDNLPSSELLREELQIPQEKLIVGNTSAIAPHKDYYTFVDAAKEVIAYGIDAHFVIAGDGPLFEDVQQYIREQKMEQHIQMLGFRKDILAVLNGFDYFLITSETEGLGTSILDAFAVGKPVIATRAGGIPEIVRHEQTGLLAPVKDPKAIAKQLIRAIENPSLSAQMIAGGKELLKDFDKRYTAQKTIDAYRTILLK